MFKGAFVAIVTPFRDGKLDEAALRGLIEFHLSNGTNGIVPCGTTGESPTLSHDEYERVIEITVEMVHGRLPVIAGTGFNATDKTVEATRFAKKAGADGALIVTPYYNRPTPEGIYQHFAAVAKAVDIPIIVYNIPGRTGTNILPDTMARLASIETVVGVKESTGSLQQVQEMIKLCGDKFTVLSGDDWATLPLLAVGGKGVISVTANIAPRQVATVISEWEKGNRSRRPRPSLQTLAPAQHVIHRDQPDASEDSPGHDGQDQPRSAPAAGADAAEQSHQAGNGPEGFWLAVSRATRDISDASDAVLPRLVEDVA